MEGCGAVAVEYAKDWVDISFAQYYQLVESCWCASVLDVPFTSNMFFRSASVKSSNAFTCAIPAFATMVFRGPSSETDAWTMFSHSSRLVTSAVKVNAFRPRDWISLTTESQPDLLAGMSLIQMS